MEIPRGSFSRGIFAFQLESPRGSFSKGFLFFNWKVQGDLGWPLQSGMVEGWFFVNPSSNPTEIFAWQMFEDLWQLLSQGFWGMYVLYFGSSWLDSANFVSSRLVSAHHCSSWLISARLGTSRLVSAHCGSSCNITAFLGLLWLDFFFFFLARWGYAFPPKWKGGKVLFLFLFGAANFFFFAWWFLGDRFFF